MPRRVRRRSRAATAIAAAAAVAVATGASRDASPVGSKRPGEPGRFAVPEPVLTKSERVLTNEAQASTDDPPAPPRPARRARRRRGAPRGGGEPRPRRERAPAACRDGDQRLEPRDLLPRPAARPSGALLRLGEPAA